MHIKRTTVAAAAAALAVLAFTATPAYADTIAIDPATGEEVVTDIEPDNSITFCGFAEGDISPEELAEMGVDETYVVTYMTQAECDAETAAAEADAAANPDPEGPDPALTETAEPSDEPTPEDEVIAPTPEPEPTTEAPAAPDFSDARDLFLNS